MCRGYMNTGQIQKNQKIYTQKHSALRGLLGGIGTGNISLDACGSFQDFEIFGYPDKGLKLPYHFFALRTCLEGEKPDTRILEAAPERTARKAMYHAGDLMGLSRFPESRFVCQYPFYDVELIDRELPFEVRFRAYTPFIPLDEDSSGMPFYQIAYRVKNCSDKDAEVSVAASILNCAGFCSYDGFDRLLQKGCRVQERREEKDLRGIFLTVEDVDAGDVSYGSMALATPQNATWKTHWQYGGWWDGAEEFWRDFSEDGALSEPAKECSQTPQERCVASAAVKQQLKPGEECEFIFYVAWHFPNRYGWWPDGHEAENKEKGARIFQNYYSVLWENAWAVVCDAWERRHYLEAKSRAFSEALYGSSLDPDVIEALVSSITVFRSCTCFRISDGTFFGWEGCFDRAGSCAGNCTHVWNYAQALAFLFPKLEQNMRMTEFLTETDDEGCMAFRAKRRLEGKPWQMYPAADGQLGCILRVYREWMLSGDESFLKKVGPIKFRDNEAIRKVTEEYIDLLQIKCTSSKQRARQLSGGNQQKICLAKAFALKPKLLFVSEPTRGIDVGAKALVLEALKKYNEENGTTIVMISSELEELRSICDRIAVVHDGKIAGTLDATRPSEEFGVLMLGEMKEAK